MQKEYQHIKKGIKSLEIKLLAFSGGTFLFGIIFSFVNYEKWYLIALSIIFFIGLAVYFGSFVSKNHKINCPVCTSGTLREDYTNPLESSEDAIEHKCDSCDSHFVDGVLRTNALNKALNTDATTVAPIS